MISTKILVYMNNFLSASAYLLDSDSFDVRQFDSPAFVATTMNRLKHLLELTFPFFLHFFPMASFSTFPPMPSSSPTPSPRLPVPTSSPTSTLHGLRYFLFAQLGFPEAGYLEYEVSSPRSDEGAADEGAAACVMQLRETKKLQEIGSNYLFLSFLLIFTG
ncbi:hypothetical protein EUGRSUZ_F02321 [Eucalyptus grandis]|uniref:Uncharacterized protein n=2 Tax=Eucalyptus grandis TaxID=71139 RepID=A0ACC3KGL9_EUCGR|nr:hypothetical protein EUGRSUZ_F02321 [Eucalyptus grandis]